MKKHYRRKILSDITLFISGVVLSMVGLYYFHMQYLCYEYTPLLFILAVAVCIGGALLSIPSRQKPDKKKTVVNAAVTALIFAVVLVGFMLLINGIIGNGELNQIALVIPVYLSFVMITVLALISVIKMFNNKILKAILSVIILIGFAIGSYSYIVPFAIDEIYKGYKAPAPVLSTYSAKKDDDKMINGDFFVSTKGNDLNSGTKDAPFLTIEKAVEAVRNTDKAGRNGITVYVEAGEYRVSSLEFTQEDSGTAESPITYCAYGGDVVLNGGITLSADDFKPITDYPTAERFTDEAKKNVVVADLTKAPYNLTKEDWGKIYAIGSYHTANSYDGDYAGELYCELFVDDQRQTLARYPDNDFLLTEEVVKTGLGKESDGALTAVENWDEIRNPESDIYRVNSDLAKRISGWETLDDVWMFGYWKYDWADY